VAGTLPTAADQRLANTVHAVASAGVSRVMGALSGCVESVAPDLAPDAQANLAVQAMEIEVDFAIDEIEQMFEAIDAGEKALRAKWGAGGNAQAANFLQPFCSFAFDLEADLQDAREIVAALLDATAPPAAPMPAPGVTPGVPPALAPAPPAATPLAR